MWLHLLPKQTSINLSLNDKKTHLNPTLDTSSAQVLNNFVNTLMQTYVKTPQQQQRGLQAHRKNQAQDGGGNERTNAVRLRQDDDYRQGNKHGHPQQGR